MQECGNNASCFESEYNQLESNFEFEFSDRKSGKKFRIDRAFKWPFRLSSIFGLHIISQNSNNTISLISVAVVSRVISFITALTVCFYILYTSFKIQLGFYIFMMAIPFWYNTVFSIGLYFNLSRHYNTWKVYLQQINMMMVSDDSKITYAMIWNIGFTLSIIITVLVTMPVTWYHVLIPYSCTCIIPTISDTFNSVFVYSITIAYGNLVERVKATAKMTLIDIEHLLVEWMTLKDTLVLHNEVR